MTISRSWRSGGLRRHFRRAVGYTERMPLFEYSEFDGSQQFTPLSAEAAFDKLSEYLLEHGEYVLRQLDRRDRDDADILKLLIKEGYLEKDEQGRLAIAPRGVRRIEDKALNELFLIQQKGN